MQIGLPYTINFTDPSLPGKDSFVIQPNTTDGPLSPIVPSPDSTATEYHTSIVLPGMGLIQYGERVDETLVHLLENFASKTSPVAPTIGQQWYDYSVPMMKVWDGIKWTAVGSNGIKIASTTEFNSLLTDVNYVIGAPSGNDSAGAHGYGQVPIASITGRAPTTLEWLALINAVRKAGSHQGTDVTKLVDTDFVLPGNDVVTYGAMTVMQQYQNLQTVISSVKANKNVVSPGSLETDLSGSGNFQRSTNWSGTIEHQLRLTFASDAHARAYFNSGGSLNMSASLTQAVNADDTAYAALLSTVGTTKLSAFGSVGGNSFTSAIGFYGLTSVDQTIRTFTVGTNTYTILANYNAATYSVTMRLQYKAAKSGTGKKLYNDGVIGGTLLSSVVMQKASELYLNSPEIPYPQISTIISLA